MGADAMLDGGDAFRIPALGAQNFGRELRRGVVMVRARVCARHGALGIVQQGCGADDFQVRAFGQGQAFGHAVDAQHVVEVVDGVGSLVPLAGLFDGGHEAPVFN